MNNTDSFGEESSAKNIDSALNEKKEPHYMQSTESSIIRASGNIQNRLKHSDRIKAEELKRLNRNSYR